MMSTWSFELSEAAWRPKCKSSGLIEEIEASTQKPRSTRYFQCSFIHSSRTVERMKTASLIIHIMCKTHYEPIELSTLRFADALAAEKMLETQIRCLDPHFRVRAFQWCHPRENNSTSLSTGNPRWRQEKRKRQ